MAKQVWFSIKKAADYTGLSRQDIRNALASGRFKSIFDGNTQTVMNEDDQPRIQVTQSALDAWVKERANPVNRGGFTRGDTHSIVVKNVKDSDRPQFEALAQQLGYTLDRAYKAGKAKTKKASTPVAATESTSTNGAEQVQQELELVEA